MVYRYANYRDGVPSRPKTTLGFLQCNHLHSSQGAQLSTSSSKPFALRSAEEGVRESGG